MLKYRSLSKDELIELEPEFKQFLIVNEIYDAEWRALASQDPEKAQSFIDLFSNIVLERVYNQVPGLVHIGNDFITVFDFQDAIWTFYHFQFTNLQQPLKCEADDFLRFIQQNWEHLSMHKGTKKSSEQKAAEIHALLSKGARPLRPLQIQEFLKSMKA